MAEKIGLQAVLQDDQFQRALKRYTQGLGVMQTRTSQVAASAGGAMGGLGGALTMGLGAAIGIVTAQLIPKLVAGLKEIGTTVIDIGSDALMAAARVQEMGIVLDYLGEQAGYSEKQLAGFVTQIRDAGMRTDVAQKAVAEFSRYQLDLAKATDLVSIAQGVAILANEDSSDSMQALIDATLTQNTLMLRRRGIIVNMGKVMEDHAASLGKAADELTDTERAAAALNAIIAAGQPLLGLYDKAMESPGKQLRSMSRYTYELLLQMGIPFQQTFGEAVFLLTDFMGALMEASREGGWLNVILQELGATVHSLAAPFIAFGQSAIGVMRDLGLVFGTFRGPDLDVMRSSVQKLQDKIAQLSPPDLSAGWQKEADEITKINRDLGTTITRLWADVNRAIAQSTDDWNRSRATSMADWIRDQQRDLEDFHRAIADLFSDLDDQLAEMKGDWREDRAREEEQWNEQRRREQEGHEDEMGRLRRDAAMAETKQEYDLIQSIMAEKEGQFQEEQALAAKERQEKLTREEAEFRAELAKEQSRVNERAGIMEEEFNRRRAREEEDRAIRLRREEEEFNLRIARQHEQASRSEADLKAASAERTTVLQAEIAAGQKAREDGYVKEKAALIEQLAAAKREYEKSLFEMPFLHEDAAKESAKAYERLSELFEVQLGIEFKEIVKAWEEKDWGQLGWVAAEMISDSFNRWAIPKIIGWNKWFALNFFTMGYASIFQMGEGHSDEAGGGADERPG